MKKFILSLALITCSSYVYSADSIQGESAQAENIASTGRLKDLVFAGRVIHLTTTIGASIDGMDWLLSKGERGGEGGLVVAAINLLPLAISMLNKQTLENATIDAACNTTAAVLGFIEGSLIVYGAIQNLHKKSKCITKQTSIAEDINLRKAPAQ